MEHYPTEIGHLPKEIIPNPDEVAPWPTLSNYLPEYLEQLGSQGSGLKTYFKDFDQKLEGLRGIVIIGGEPGSGKTALALQIGFDTAVDNIPVVIYSFEMPKSQLVTRFFQRIGKISYRNMQRKLDQFDDVDVTNLHNTQATISSVADRIIIRETKDFFKEGTGSISTVFDFSEQIRHINQIKEQFGKPPLIVIDSLHEIPVDLQYSGDLKKKIDFIMLNLRNMCDQTGATFLLISHQSRSSQNEAKLQGFLGSASIEYTVDMALIIAIPTGVEKERDRRLIVAKNRYGPKPECDLLFDGKYMEFTSQLKKF